MKQSLIHLRATFKTKEEAWIQFRFEKIYFDIESRHRAKNPGGGNSDEKSGVTLTFMRNPGFFVAVYPPGFFAEG